MHTMGSLHMHQIMWFIRELTTPKLLIYKRITLQKAAEEKYFT